VDVETSRGVVEVGSISSMVSSFSISGPGDSGPGDSARLVEAENAPADSSPPARALDVVIGGGWE
jgi:hypothetical protein